MINLLNAIADLENQRKVLAQKHAAEMKDMDDAISFLRTQNQACWYCRGKGKLLRSRACAEDDRPDENDPRDWMTCKACHGTGVKHWDTDKGKVTIDPKTGFVIPATAAQEESHSYLAAMK